MAKQNFLSKVVSASGSAAKSFLGMGGGIVDTQVLAPYGYRGGMNNGTPFGSAGWLFGGANGLDVHFSFNGLDDIVNAYQKCPPIFSIVNKQATAFLNGHVKIKSNDPKKEPAAALLAKLQPLLANPNPLQNWKQFEAQLVIYLRLFGFVVILPVKPSGFPNEDAKALWIIPSFMCEFTFNEKMFYTLDRGYITDIKVTYGTEISHLIPGDMIIIRDISIGIQSVYIPGSPIKPIAQNINNIIGIYNSKGMLINYRGALGILTPEIDPAGAIAVDPGEKQSLEMDLMKYGLKPGQQKFIIAAKKYSGNGCFIKKQFYFGTPAKYTYKSILRRHQ